MQRSSRLPCCAGLGLTLRVGITSSRANQSLGFGDIGIGRQNYDADVIIFPDHIQARWRRREEHRLAQENLETVLSGKPQLLIIETGYCGRMRVLEETLDSLRTASVDVRVATINEQDQTETQM